MTSVFDVDLSLVVKTWLDIVIALSYISKERSSGAAIGRKTEARFGERRVMGALQRFSISIRN